MLETWILSHSYFISEFEKLKGMYSLKLILIAIWEV